MNKKNLLVELEKIGADWVHYAWCMSVFRHHGYEMAEKYVNSLKVTLNRETEMDGCVV